DSRLSGACESVAPFDAYYTSCPAPCDGIAVSDWTSVGECMSCIVASHVGSFADAALGSASVPLNEQEANCALSMYATAREMVSAVLQAHRRCQQRAATPNACLELPKSTRAKLMKARRKIWDNVSPACDTANFAALGTCATGLSDSGCVSASAERYGALLAYDGARMLGAVPNDSPLTTLTDIGTTDDNTCGIRSDGTVACWGANMFAESTPPPGTFSKLSVGGANVCGLRPDGSLDCWGARNLSSAPSGTFVQVSVGYLNSCGVRTDGSIQCWGNNEYGQGNAALGTFTQVGASQSFSCGLRSDQTIACWGGRNGPVTPPTGTFVELAVGGYACARRADGTAICWSDGADPIGPEPDETFVAIRSHGARACGLTPAMDIECWGPDIYPAPGGPFQDFSVGYYGGCGLRPDGGV